MSSTNSSITTMWAFKIFEIFRRFQISSICISPGFRNSLLVYAAQKNKEFRLSSHIDERSAAYFALGISKSTKVPSILICTSGTAVANYYPAIIEASYSRCPLIILTADRPMELIGSGNNQTIKQKDIFSDHVRLFFDLGMPQENTEKLNQVLYDAVLTSFGRNDKEPLPPGPVHINIPFDEPIIDYDLNFSNNENNNILIQSKPLMQFNKQNIKADNPLIIIGESIDYDLDDIIKLVKKIFSVPIFADPLSQLRSRNSPNNVIVNYDLFIDQINVLPDIIIRIGRKPTSKKLCNFIDKHNEKVFLIDSYHRFNDNAKHIIYLNELSSIDKIFTITTTNDWLDYFIQLDKRLDDIKKDCLVQSKYLTEPIIINHLIHNISNQSIFIGNSMPIRNLDIFLSNESKQLHFFSNRGASGIDGIISTALGCASIKDNMILLIGDLSFYHDMNGLLAAKRYNLNLLIIIFNNNGGQIFNKVNIKKARINRFDEFWITPTDLDYSYVGDLYGARFIEVNNFDSYIKAFKVMNSKSGLRIINAKINPSNESKLSKDLLNRVEASLK